MHLRIHFTAPHVEERGYYEATVEESGDVARSLGSCGDSELDESKLYRVTRLKRVVGHAVDVTGTPEVVAAR